MDNKATAIELLEDLIKQIKEDKITVIRFGRREIGVKVEDGAEVAYSAEIEYVRL